MRNLLFIILSVCIIGCSEEEVKAPQKEVLAKENDTITQAEIDKLFSCEPKPKPENYVGTSQPIEARKLAPRAITNNDHDIISAAYAGELHIIQSEFAKDKDKLFIARNSVGTTTLMAASIMGKTELVDFLLNSKDLKTDHLNYGDNTGNTALHYAVSGENAEIVMTLREHGANPNIYNLKKNTAVHNAFNKSRNPVRGQPLYSLTTISAMLTNITGAIYPNLEIENIEGITPASLAKKTSSKTVIEYLAKTICLAKE